MKMPSFVAIFCAITALPSAAQSGLITSPAMSSIVVRFQAELAGPNIVQSVADTGSLTPNQNTELKRLEGTATMLVKREKARRSPYAKGDELLSLAMRVDFFRGLELGMSLFAKEHPSEEETRNATACYSIVKVSAEKGSFMGWRIPNKGFCLDIDDDSPVSEVVEAMQEYLSSEEDVERTRIANAKADKQMSNQ